MGGLEKPIKLNGKSSLISYHDNHLLSVSIKSGTNRVPKSNFLVSTGSVLMMHMHLYNWIGLSSLNWSTLTSCLIHLQPTTNTYSLLLFTFFTFSFLKLTCPVRGVLHGGHGREWGIRTNNWLSRQTFATITPQISITIAATTTISSLSNGSPISSYFIKMCHVFSWTM